MLTTYRLSDTAHDAGGAVLPGAKVRIQLTDTKGRPAADFFVGSGSQQPVVVEKTADDSGAWSADLPSNLDGNQDLRYRVTITHPTAGTGLVDELIQMPRAASALAALVDASSVDPTPQTEAALQAGYAEEWAQKAEDAPVSTDAGGDGSTDFSSLHWSEKSREWAQTPYGVDVPGGSVGDRSSRHYADVAEDWAATEGAVPTASGGDGTLKGAKGYSLLSKDWAQKVGAAVVTGLYSAREWAVGTFTRGAAGGGSARDWATLTGRTVDDTEYGAAEYATGTLTAHGGSAKNWAQKVGSAVVTGLYSAREWAIGTATRGSAGGGSARDWASLKGQTVDASEYGAAEYAVGDLTAHGGSSKAWAQDGSSPDGTTSKSAKTWANEAAASTQRVDLLGALEYALDQAGQVARALPALEGQAEDLYAALSGLEHALDIAGQVARQVNGGRVSLRGGSLADPALRIGTAKIYSSADDTLSVGIGDSEILRVTSAGLTVYGTVTEA